MKLLSEKMLNLVGLGAKQVFGAHHAGKGWRNISEMTADNMFRGSGEMQAACSNAFGVLQTDEQLNQVFVRYFFSRDNEPSLVDDFLLQGRPFLGEEKMFKIVKQPAIFGEEHKAEKKKPGPDEDPEKWAKMQYIESLLREDLFPADMGPARMAEEINRKFKSNHSSQVVGRWWKKYKESPDVAGQPEREKQQ